MIFRNRTEAALELIPFLEKYRNDDGIILAIPRGGVPLGHVIAKYFHFPLDLILTKKIGHPINKEFAIGAVSLDGKIIDPRSDVSEEYLVEEVARLRESLKERYRQFLGNRPQSKLNGKTVIIVDDGLATGNTALAAIKMIRKQNPAKIIVAVPVAAPGTTSRVGKECDELICLSTPLDFFGVGQFYEDFSEVGDQQVKELINDVNYRT